MQKICKQVKIACISSGQTFAYLLLTKIYTSQKGKKWKLVQKNMINFGINLDTNSLGAVLKSSWFQFKIHLKNCAVGLSKCKIVPFFSYISHLCIMHWINRVTLLSCWMISKILFNMNIPNKTWLIGRGFLTSSSPIYLILQFQWRKYYHISSSRLAMYMHMCKVKNDFAGSYFFQFPFCHNTSFQKKK